ncbi:MAG: acyltransferase family protein [Solirubrobacterales bacterium]|nr:acyltransferase family protein [Solirubrobacterales bacterium]
MRGNDATAARGAAEGGARKRPGFRPDVEGLRAVALLAILLYHASLPFARGGIVGPDVFFVVSGFLITRLLVDEAERTGTIALGRFYAHRAKRLLPLAATVLIAVAVLAALLLPASRSDAVAGDVFSSALYVVNWHFAAQSVDYFAGGYAGSPLQHFWTLSIEEQFYIVWPALLLAFGWLWGRRGGSMRTGAWIAVAVVGTASLTYGIWYSFESPGQAYFSTFARCWDMAIGGALALATFPRLRTSLAAVLGFAGLAAILVGTFAFDDTIPYPGVAALAPALGTGLVIAAGSASAGAAWSSRMLGVAPMRWMGRMSYAWYMWHWPALIFGAALLGPLSVGARLGLIVGSLIPAVISHRLVEEPLRRSPILRSRPRRAFAVGGACTALTLVAAAALVVTEPSIPTLPADEVRGAAAIEDQPTPQRVAQRLTPSPIKAGDDRSEMQDDGCLVELEETESKPCVYGDPDSETTVVLYGDSLAMQYFPAAAKLAKQRDWRLVGLTKAGCTPAELTVYNHRLEREYTECDDWREDTLQRISEQEKPDLILVSGRISTPVMEDGEVLDEEAGLDRMEDGYVRVLERLRETGSRVAVIKDLPPSPRNVPDCVSESLRDLEECTFRPDRAHLEAPDNHAAARVDGVQLIDLTPLVCPDGLCRAVIGDALVFRDYDHLTPTFAATLAPMLGRQLPTIN